jgi:hypothetical protein
VRRTRESGVIQRQELHLAFFACHPHFFENELRIGKR